MGVSDTPLPGDYDPPINRNYLEAPALPPGVTHPSGQTPDSHPETVDDEETETAAQEELEDPQITPYPSAPPTIEGAQLTQSVFQSGPQ